MFFICKSQVPAGHTVTYTRTICAFHPKKKDPNCNRIIADVNPITDQPGDTSTEISGLEIIKLHWNSVLFTPNAKWMGIDISNMYLNNPLD